MTSSRSQATAAVLQPPTMFQSDPPPPGSARDTSSRFVVVSWGDEKVEAQVLGVRGVAPNVQLHLARPCEPALPVDGDRVEIDLHVSELPAGAAAYWLGCTDPTCTDPTCAAPGCREPGCTQGGSAEAGCTEEAGWADLSPRGQDARSSAGAQGRRAEARPVGA